MKNAYLLPYMVVFTITLHGMERALIPAHQQRSQNHQTQQIINPWQNIDCFAVHSDLVNDYQGFAKSRLFEYKKADFKSQDMDYIKNKSADYTGVNDVAFLFDAHDENNNYFIHVAVQKFDRPILTWLLHEKDKHYPINSDNKGAIELCIDQLSPTNNISTDRKDIAKEMLDDLTIAYENQLPIALRKSIVEKLIALQIAHKQHSNTHLLSDVFFTRFLTNGMHPVAPLDLKPLFQYVADKETGNTLSHAAVELRDADGLYELIKKDYVSPAKNKMKLDVLQLAHENFKKYTQDPSQFDLDKEQATRTGCCVLMLIKYIAIRRNERRIPIFNCCCGKHIINVEERNNIPKITNF